MELKRLPFDLSVCQAADIKDFDMNADFFFIGSVTKRDDGWRGFRIQGILDFSLIGILSKLSGILAEHKIGIFAVSTYNTDYILVKKENFERALEVLTLAGYTVVI